MRAASILLLILLLLPLPARADDPPFIPPLEYGKYHALVIGNNDYANLPKLETAVADATAVAKVLEERYGFEVNLLINANRVQIVQALNDYRASLTERDNLLIYYAGHGYLDFESDSGFWLPVDANRASEANWLDMATLTRNMRAMSAKHIMVIADSCFSGTLVRAAPSVKLSTGKDREAWFDRMRAKRARTALTSGGLEPVVDGGGNGHSVFTNALLQVLQENRDVIPGDVLFSSLRGAVVMNAAQTPQYADVRFAGHDGGDFLFVPRREVVDPPKPPPVPVVQANQPVPSVESALTPAGDTKATVDPMLEKTFWEAIKDSKNPQMFEAFLQQFPNGLLAPLARVMVDTLRREQGQPPQERSLAAAPPAAPVATPPRSASPVATPDKEPPAERSAPPQRTAALTPPEPKPPAMEKVMGLHEALAASNIRDRPASDGQRIGRLTEGQPVLVTGKTGDWFRIDTPDGGVGYVYAELLQRSAADDGGPAAADPAAAPAAPAAAEPQRTAALQAPPPPSATAGLGKGFRDCDDCPELVSLPAGAFTMGNNATDPSEAPAHRVRIERPFAIGVREVTVGEWWKCHEAGGCTLKPAHQNAGVPMNNLSHRDAEQYVEWLSKLTGKRYRLPTEAEWEYAARGGTDTKFWWGAKFEPGRADCKGCGGAWNADLPGEASAFPANGFGLFNTSGGVAEWVSDCWHANFQGAPADGTAWSDANCRSGVLKGGSWRNDISYLPPSTRMQYDLAVRYLANGVRVVRELP